MNRAVVLILAASLAGALEAQTTSLINETKQMYEGVKNNLIRAAEAMPEADYSFKPTEAQQPFSQRMMHVANQIRTCSAIAGARKTIDNTKTAKADVVSALKESFDACDAAWAGMNDKTAMETIAGRGGERTKLGTLIGNTNHDSEMYGYIANYLRLKGVTPPSSERRR
jgi:hypothetical protein